MGILWVKVVLCLQDIQLYNEILKNRHLVLSFAGLYTPSKSVMDTLRGKTKSSLCFIQIRKRIRKNSELQEQKTFGYVGCRFRDESA